MQMVMMMMMLTMAVGGEVCVPCAKGSEQMKMDGSTDGPKPTRVLCDTRNFFQLKCGITP